MRLTKRSNKTVHENGVCCTHFNGKECSERMGECTDNCPWEEAVWSKLADYEDAEEQGLLLRLPVPIGSTVYVIESECEGDIYDCSHCCEHCACLNTFVSEVKFDAEWFDCIGKTVFLTREEAEVALAEKGGSE